jgi:hypothetical protein
MMPTKYSHDNSHDNGRGNGHGGNGHGGNSHGGNGHGGNGHGGNGRGGNTPTVITGRNLAHSPRSKTERAFIALDWARGDVDFVRPTFGQAAKLAGVNRDYLTKAARMTTTERFAVETGCRKIYAPATLAPAPAPVVTDSTRGLFQVPDDWWQQVSAAERRQWVRKNAPELWTVLDAITAPAGTDPDVLLPEGM